MSDKCSVCGEKIEVSFLGKIFGTYVKGHPVCSKCQRKYMFDIVKHIPDSKRTKELDNASTN